MSILESLIHSPLAKALGWSLVHFLWQGAAIALILSVLLFLSRTAASRLRYALCCLALFAMPLAFAITVALTFPSGRPAAAISWPPRAPDAAGALQQASLSIPRPLADRLRDALPWLVPFWMAGVLLFYIRSVGGWIAMQRLRGAGVCAAPLEWQERLHRLRARLRVSRPVTLLESCFIDIPVVIGFLRPTILMPAGLVMGLSTSQIESILIHELAHVRRRDYLVNVLQKFVECVLFYHPAVWWISGLVRAERENCCDDIVVELNGDPRGYAAALATLETNRWPAADPALAANGGSLMKRIRRLLESERPHAGSAPIVAVGLLVLSLSMALGAWQTNRTPAPAPQAVPPPIASQPADPPQPRKRPATLVAQDRPATAAPKGATGAIDTSGIMSPYQKWVKEDVAYIITDEERQAFKALPTDAEREHFIEQFWLRRDPTPGTPENEFKEEHYRRIAYANEHFASRIPGWKTDRGRIYITFGPPDEIESHPSGGAYQRPPAEGGGTTSTFPFEQWRYRYIQDIGNNIIIEFVDPTMTGEYRMTMDPSEKDALRFVTPPAVPPAVPPAKAGATVQLMASGAAMLSVPLSSYGGHVIKVTFRVVSSSGEPVATFNDKVAAPHALYNRFVSLPPGAYRFLVSLQDTVTGAQAADDVSFEIK